MDRAARICFLLFFLVSIVSGIYAKGLIHTFPPDSATAVQNTHRSADTVFTHSGDSSNSALFWDGYTTVGADSSILIYQNYPNPFSGITNIIFQIADSTLYGEEISIIVYDERGNEMELLYDDLADDAIHSTTFDGAFFRSGFYLCAARCGGHATIRLMNLVH